MTSYDTRETLSHELASTLRKADVLTGEFFRPVSAEALSRLESLGLASVSDEALTPRGMAVRSWLMSGSESAAWELSKLARSLATETRYLEKAVGPVSAALAAGFRHSWEMRA